MLSNTSGNAFWNMFMNALGEIGCEIKWKARENKHNARG
jgi:hypothetical protein